ncbi:MAG: DNA translocase FtsK [Candidatus Omnitrophica bacterium]|nr:DNA translocase FtsK [Candidatus Omnitrophota bacterium]
MKPEHINEIKAIVILAIGLILLASLASFTPADLSWYTSQPNNPPHNLIRVTGAYLAGSLFFIFGYSAYILVIFLLFIGWNKFTSREMRLSFPKTLSFFILFGTVSSAIGMVGAGDASSRFQRAGLIGWAMSDFLSRYLGVTGAWIILTAFGILSLIVTCEFLVAPIVKACMERVREKGLAIREKLSSGNGLAVASAGGKNPGKPARAPADKIPAAGADKNANADVFEYEFAEPASLVKTSAASPAGRTEKPNIKITQPEAPRESVIEKTADPRGGEYRLPPLDLLDDPPKISTDKIQTTLMTDAKLLEETLAQFNVVAKVVDIERGPAITRYELEPSPGTRVQQFTSLDDDIALAMRAATVRIVAPIPGTNRVGIEVPNGSAASVYLKEVLSGTEFRAAKSKLTLCLGKDIAGKSMVANLADMPHLLIAGTTGSGKTVCVNGIIMSILLNASPDEVRFVMVDPKMVELAGYNDIPHLLCPTVTDAKKASAVLHWVVGEMENRYKKLSKEGVRNIKAYNAKGHLMPYIVVIIDELADLMQISAKTVEGSIARLAQLSRAVGIHLILATQRPSVDVITGVIKANFPARISFKVASKVDSRTVLDMNGAEALLGKGDMLFIQPGEAKPTRGQGNFVKDEEIARVIEFIKKQRQPDYDDTILNSQRGDNGAGGSEERDEFYDEAVRLVVETNQASVSILQRRMRLGYTRAARLIDMMEQGGIVGPYCGSKPRDILVDREQWLLEHMQENQKGPSDGESSPA